ncbi:MAG: hypothetical protein OEY17_02540 [Nitrosopumilus sp.]|nr:hypothetical protein [Nitrosopumilus sp.]
MKTFVGIALGLLTFTGIAPGLAPGELVYISLPPGAATLATLLPFKEQADRPTKAALSVRVQYVLTLLVGLVCVSLFVVLATRGKWLSIFAIFKAFGLF